MKIFSNSSQNSPWVSPGIPTKFHHTIPPENPEWNLPSMFSGIALGLLPEIFSSILQRIFPRIPSGIYSDISLNFLSIRSSLIGFFRDSLTGFQKYFPGISSAISPEILSISLGILHSAIPDFFFKDYSRFLSRLIFSRGSFRFLRAFPRGNLRGYLHSFQLDFFP